MKFRLWKVRLNSQGYTDDGVYFGVGQPLYYYESESDSYDGKYYNFFRSFNREWAKERILKAHPDAKFYR